MIEDTLRETEQEVIPELRQTLEGVTMHDEDKTLSPPAPPRSSDVEGAGGVT